MSNSETLPTVWEIPDDLWLLIKPKLDELYPPCPVGRSRANLRSVLNAIIYIMRTGCQWRALPDSFGYRKSCVHEWHQRFSRDGAYDLFWAEIVERCAELDGVNFEWQSVDCSFAKAPLAKEEVGPNPTDRAKQGVKRSVLCDGDGFPLSVDIAAANVNDHLLLESTLRGMIIERPKDKEVQEHICLDRAYDNGFVEETCEEHGYEAHIRRRGVEDEGLREDGKDPRRWVVERLMSWFNRFRKILIRWTKKAKNYEGYLEFASTLMWYRKWWRLR